MIKITHLESHNEESVAMSVFNHLKMSMPTTYFEVKVADHNSNKKIWKNKPSVYHELQSIFKDKNNEKVEISKDDFFQLVEELKKG